MSMQDKPVVFGTEDLLLSLCNSVSAVLSKATRGEIRFSGMVQKITKTCLKPDIGCFVLFDGGFSGLVVINLSAQAAMELYEKYMIEMGMARAELATSYTSDEVSNVMGELMNQIVGDFIGKQTQLAGIRNRQLITVNTNLLDTSRSVDKQLSSNLIDRLITIKRQRRHLARVPIATFRLRVDIDATSSHLLLA